MKKQSVIQLNFRLPYHNNHVTILLNMKDSVFRNRGFNILLVFLTSLIQATLVDSETVAERKSSQLCMPSLANPMYYSLVKAFYNVRYFDS